MTAAIAIALAIAVSGIGTLRRRAGVAAAVALFIVAPAAAVVVMVGVAAGGVARRRLRHRAAAAAATADVPLLVDLVGLAIAAGLPPTTALARVRGSVHPDLAHEVGEALDAARRHGAAAALAATPGRAADLHRTIARAVVTGSDVGPELAVLADRLRHEERAARVAAARRLPVRMLFPLALLILPGFVVMAVAPAVIGSLRRLAL